MTPERFALVKQFFEELCELPPEQQAARLGALTDDAEVAGTVKKLLQQTQSDHPRALRPIADAMSEFAGGQINIGDVLGVWKLTAEIGQGGMGRVFRAARSDGQFDQVAAVKVLQGLPSARALEYLARERQILASLIHPNIARLYDGGATPGGQPYLVMEYIDGVGIDRYIGLHHAPVSARLTLMLAICDALSFAHQHLIVHCDIKPSNILVTPSGRPMLLDFGIARLLDGEPVNEPDTALPADASGKHTLARAFTPQYASPEQKKGEVLTTATDVYSLGSLLNELLALPDRSARAPKLDVELRAIIAKAAHQDVAQRYPTAVALSADIERYLARQPLLAMPRTAGYISQKFVERFWPWLGATMIVVATVAMATQRVVVERDRARAAEQAAVRERDATRLAQAETARERDRAAGAEQVAGRQRDRAQAAESNAVEDRDRARASEAKAVAERNRASLAEAASRLAEAASRQAEAASRQAEAASRQAEASSRQTSEFLVSVFDSSNPNAESGDIPASKLIAAAETRVEKEMQGQSATQAELYSALARVQSNMGNTRQANENYRRALELERTRNRPLVLAQILNRQATLRGANFGVAEAEPYAREALLLREQNAAPDSEELAESLATLGNILTGLGKRDEALSLLTRSLRIRETRDPAGTGVATSLHYLALHSVRFDAFEKAISEFERSLTVRAAQVGQAHPDYLATQEEYGNVLNMTRRYAQAEQVMRQALRERRRLHGNENEKIAFGLNVLGSVVNRQGRRREAITLYQEALAIVEKKFGKRSMPYASVLNNLAIPLQNVGDFASAESAYVEAMTIFESIWPDTDLTLARVRYNVARVRREMNETDRAEAPLFKSYAVRQKVLGDKHGDVIESLLEIAHWYLATGSLTKVDETLAKIAPQMPVKDAFVVISHARLQANLAGKRGLVAEALQGHAQAEQLSTKLYGEKDAISWLAKLPRAELLAARNQGDDRAQSRALAASIVDNVKGELAPDSPVWEKLRQLRL